MTTGRDTSAAASGFTAVGPAPTSPTVTTGPATAGTRRHDLDALRGFAMLLGIALHVSLSFFPGFWVVVDSSGSERQWFDEFFHAVHGFRMPLFFLLSGFFTTMLWRRRGLRSLVEHRIRRIALPLAIGAITIVPLTNWSIESAIDDGVDDYIAANDDIWAAVFFGNNDAVDTLLDRGIDVDARNLAEGGDTPLHIAAFTGDTEIATLLLGRGADADAVAAGGRPIDYAVFFGHADVADILVDAGVDDPRPVGTAWAALPGFADGAADVEQVQAKFGLASWLTSTHHLWFLWFLLLIIAGFVVVALVGDRFASDATTAAGTPGRLSGWVMWALIPLTLLPQLAMGDGGDVRVFGPDTSTGWLPIWHVIGYYAVFFSFGALLYGRTDRKGRPTVESIGRAWPVLLPTAAVAFVVALDLTDDRDVSWTIASAAQVAYAWLAIVALIGLFRAALGVERRGVRFLSDSAYWLYLAHLPLVIVAQSWMRNWDVPATVKFSLLVVGVTVLLLGSYRVFVRYSPIGTLLNGKRTRPRPS